MRTALSTDSHTILIKNRSLRKDTSKLVKSVHSPPVCVRRKVWHFGREWVSVPRNPWFLSASRLPCNVTITGLDWSSKLASIIQTFESWIGSGSFKQMGFSSTLIPISNTDLQASRGFWGKCYSHLRDVEAKRAQALNSFCIKISTIRPNSIWFDSRIQVSDRFFWIDSCIY